MTLSDQRFIVLSQWLEDQLSVNFTLTLISGDASFRRYFRVATEQGSLIAVDSPPKLVPVLPFVDLSKTYSNAGIKVPEVIAVSEQQGFMLLSDLGDMQLGSCLNDDNVETWYKRALLLLPSVLSVTVSLGKTLPAYDVSFIAREFDIFTDWLLSKHLNLIVDTKTKLILEHTFSLLSQSALAQPQAGMHRDFHSRNIMVKDDELWLIDFQDAVKGPVTYDAVSLLRDCYVRWPNNLVNDLMKFHYQLLLQYQYLPVTTAFSDYQRWFDFMGLQRHIKAAGIFARLHHRDHKSGYLKDIPLTLNYIADIASGYPELAEFYTWVSTQLIPAYDIKTQKDGSYDHK